MFTDFEFAGQRLSDFDCITCNINKSSSVEEFDIGCELTFNTVKNNHSSIHYPTSTSYENVYIISFEIMKNPCDKTQEDIYMTYDKVRKITRWLNRRSYEKFKPLCYDGNLVSDVSYYGSFNVKEIVLNGMVVGLSLTFTSDAPYGFGETITNEFNNLIPSNFYIYGDSDELGVVYPIITITVGEIAEDEVFFIENITTGTKIKIQNCVNGEIIKINGEHKIITTDNIEHQNTIYNDFNYEFFDIFIGNEFDNKNEYIASSCNLVIEYNPIRKAGVC